MSAIPTPLITNWFFVSGAPVGESCEVPWLSGASWCWLAGNCIEWLDFDSFTTMNLTSGTTTGLLNTVL